MAWLRQRAVQRALVWAAALVGPGVMTLVLVRFGGHEQRDYVFIYLAAVAVIGLLGGLWPAFLSAAFSFVLVDFFFVPPVGSFTIADEQDIVNLLAFAITAGLVGWLASRRRSVLLAGEALGRQLREANMELVRLNKEQAAAAQAALRVARSEQQVRALQETDRLRRELLANVSHELRTPLGTILTESTDTSGMELSDEARRRFDTIAGEARRLNALVDDMLDMARIESGALELDLEPILLGDAIRASVDRLHSGTPGRHVKVAGKVAGVEVLADWDRLGQIFDNLLTNADRFSPPDRPISIEVSRGKPGLVTIRVIDQGPGIAPELREHAFDRFVRSASNPDGSTSSGSGLGLSIVKGLVEAHAGAVEVEAPARGVGAVLRFTLPEAE
jgi:K+-sensing histidine kinase KdpD